MSRHRSNVVAYLARWATLLTPAAFAQVLAGQMLDAPSATREESPPARLGGTGAPIETEQLGSGGRGLLYDNEPVAYCRRSREFKLAYAFETGTVEARRMLPPSDAINVAYGVGCNDTGLRFSASQPLAGSELFTITLQDASLRVPVIPAGMIAVLSLSVAPAQTPIRGNPGCLWLVSRLAGEHIVDLRATASPGRISVTYPLPDDPVLRLDLHGQWSWFPTRDTIGASHGLRMQVR